MKSIRSDIFKRYASGVSIRPVYFRGHAPVISFITVPKPTTRNRFITIVVSKTLISNILMVTRLRTAIIDKQ